MSVAKAMAKKSFKFTQERIRKLPLPEKGRVDYYDFEHPKLTCRVSHTGLKTFVVIKKNESGKVQRLTLGRFPDISVKRAQQLAVENLDMMARGLNPIETKKEKRRQSIKLGELLEQYIEQKDLKSGTAHDYRKKARQGFSDWFGKQAHTITEEMILKRHKELSTSSPTTRDNKLRVLRLVMQYAVATKVIKDSPVDVLKRAKLWSKPNRKNRIIPADRLADWYHAALNLENRNTKVFLLILLHTGLRTGEALSLRWSDIDFQADTMLIRDPKNKNDFTAYIPRQLKPVLREQQTETGHLGYVFASQGKTGFMSTPKKPIARLIESTGIEFSPHDLRRTFSTIAEVVAIPETLLRRLLNHKTDNNVTTGYIRTEADTLRQATQKIADYIQDKVTTDYDNVELMRVTPRKTKNTERNPK